MKYLALRTVAVIVFTLGCVAPTTRVGTVSRDLVAAEQLKQQQLVIRSGFEEQRRVEDIAWPLLRAGLPLCTAAGKTTARSGIRFSNVYQFSREYQPAARAMGFSDTAVVVGVTKGSAADRMGLKVGDRVHAISGWTVPTGPTAANAITRQLDEARKLAVPTLSYAVRRGPLPVGESGSEVSDTGTVLLDLPADSVCAFNVMSAKDNTINAWADGTNVTITTGIQRFASSDDELAVVIAHEIAHNAMKHMDAKKANAVAGGIFGAILDIAAATQGVNTGGELTKAGMNAGSEVFSQDFEREADYVGMYILARADRPIDRAPDFWRRMAQESPGSIKYATTHPTTAERFLLLEKAVAEIQAKRSSGGELMPETLSGAASSLPTAPPNLTPREFADSTGATWKVSIQQRSFTKAEGFRFEGPNGAVKFAVFLDAAKLGISTNDDDLRALLARARWEKRPK